MPPPAKVDVCFVKDAPIDGAENLLMWQHYWDIKGPYSSDPYRAGYNVTPDGKRFIMVKVSDGSAPRQINVIVNWFEELRRRASTDKSK